MTTATTPAIRENDLKKLKHMIGADGHPKRHWGFRNHYATNGGESMEAMRRLEADGFVVQGHAGDRMTFFHATEAGCRAAGLTGKQITRALED